MHGNKLREALGQAGEMLAGALLDEEDGIDSALEAMPGEPLAVSCQVKLTRYSPEHLHVKTRVSYSTGKVTVEDEARVGGQQDLPLGSEK